MTSDPSAGPHVVYLAGFGRSGSTLLERLLGARPGWTNVGELVDLPRSVTVNHERCGCGEPFDECPRWTPVGELAFGGWDTPAVRRLAELRWLVGRQRQLPRLLLHYAAPSRDRAFDALLREYQEGYGAIYRAVAEVSGCDTIVDASKGPAHGVALSGADGYSLSLLNLVRDPRAVAYSWSRRRLTRTQAIGGPDDMWQISATRSAVQWSALQGELELVKARRRLAVSRITYEDLVDRPVPAIVESLDRLGITTSPQADLPHLEGRTAHLGPSHGLSGNPGRYDTGEITLRGDDRWRSGLPVREQRAVTALCLPLLAAYGYPLRLSPTSSTSPSARSKMTDTPTTAPEDRRPDEDGTLPLVSAVIPTRGRPELLRLTIASIVAQDYAGPLEVLVVHDKEEADPTLAELTVPGRTVRSIANDGTTGLAGARNTGLRHTTGEIVASCDDDDLWHPTKIRKQVDRLRADPALLAVGTGIRLLMSADRIVDWPGKEERVSHDRLLGSRVKELHSSTLAMWRTSFETAGVYDEQLPNGYGEDYDWLLRASAVGPLGVVTEPLADIRKDVPSWFRDRADNTIAAFEYLLDKHEDFAHHRRGHARILGQIAYAHATAGRRSVALRTAGRALRVYPAAPQAWLAVAGATTGVDPGRVLKVARAFGRGVA